MPTRRLASAAASVALVMLLHGFASADPAATTTRSAGDAAPTPRRHAVYLEVFGRGGLWGVGYDYQVNRWFGAGATASFSVLDNQRVAALSPYLALYPLGHGHHRAFLHLGPQLFHVATPSPVPEWNGTSSNGVGAALSAGYEYRNHVLVRVYAMGEAGRGGTAPWLGASLGWTF